MNTKSPSRGRIKMVHKNLRFLKQNEIASDKFPVPCLKHHYL